MRFPWQRKDSGSPKADFRDMSIDDFSQVVMQFQGNSYPTTSGGYNGAWQFGGYLPPSGATPNQEPASDNFDDMAGGIYKSSAAVFSCHNYRRALFCEARMTFQKPGENGRPGDLADGPGLDILREPWPMGQTRDLLTRAIIHADIAGNAFMIRDVFDGIDQIKFLRPDWTSIIMSGDPNVDEYVTPMALIYRPGNTQDPDKWITYPFDGTNGRVAHWAPIPDPQSHYRGMSWLDPIIREALTDKAMAKTKLSYFQNGARPGIIATFDPQVTPEAAGAFQEKFLQTKVGANNAYKPWFIGGGCNITTLNLNAEDFEKISSIGELRIAAVAQVPPTLVGLTESMKGSALNQGNFQAAKDAFADGTMRPLWGSFCAAIASLVDIPKGQRLWYDDRDIAFLRQDQQLVAQRKQTEATTASRLVQDGWKPDAAIKFLLNDDLNELIGGHTGLYSVQLMPAGVAHAQNFDGVDQADLEAEKLAKQQQESGSKPSGYQKKPIANNAGTGSSKQPRPGRPSKPNSGQQK